MTHMCDIDVNHMRQAYVLFVHTYVDKHTSFCDTHVCQKSHMCAHMFDTFMFLVSFLDLMLIFG